MDILIEVPISITGSINVLKKHMVIYLMEKFVTKLQHSFVIKVFCTIKIEELSSYGEGS